MQCGRHGRQPQRQGRPRVGLASAHALSRHRRRHLPLCCLLRRLLPLLLRVPRRRRCCCAAAALEQRCNQRFLLCRRQKLAALHRIRHEHRHRGAADTGGEESGQLERVQGRQRQGEEGVSQLEAAHRSNPCPTHTRRAASSSTPGCIQPHPPILPHCKLKLQRPAQRRQHCRRRSAAEHGWIGGVEWERGRSNAGAKPTPAEVPAPGAHSRQANKQQHWWAGRPHT